MDKKMSMQSRITTALADFDDFLTEGLTIENALRSAALTNKVSELVLAARAGRDMSLEERRRQVIFRANSDRQAANLAREKTRLQHQRGYYRKLPSGKKIWIEPSQSKFDF